MAGENIIPISVTASQALSELSKVEKSLNSVSKESRNTQASLLGMEVAVERTAKTLQSQTSKVDSLTRSNKALRSEFATMSTSVTGLTNAVSQAVSKFNSLQSAQKQLTSSALTMGTAQANFSKELLKTITQMSKAEATTAKATLAQTRYNAEALRMIQQSSALGAALQQRVSSLEKQVRALQQNTTARQKLTQEEEKAQKVTRNTIASNNTLATSFTNLTSTVMRFIAAYAGIQTLKNIASTAIHLDSLNKSFAAIQGSSSAARKEMKYVSDTAERLGLDVMALTESYKGFSAATKFAHMSLQESQMIFTSISEASTVLGLSADRTKLVLMALEQMVSKGVVSMEELRRQLGDSLPGAFELGAKAMNMGLQEFNKFVASGQLLSEIFLPKFAKTVKETFSSGLAAAIVTPRAELQRLVNDFVDAKRIIGDGGFLDGLKNAAKELHAIFQTTEMKESLYQIGHAFGELVGWLGKAVAFVMRYNDAITTLIKTYAALYVSIKVGTAAMALSAGIVSGLTGNIVGLVASIAAFTAATVLMNKVSFGGELSKAQKAAIEYKTSVEDATKEIIMQADVYEGLDNAANQRAIKEDAITKIMQQQKVLASQIKEINENKLPVPNTDKGTTSAMPLSNYFGELDDVGLDLEEITQKLKTMRSATEGVNPIIATFGEKVKALQDNFGKIDPDEWASNFKEVAGAMKEALVTEQLKEYNEYLTQLNDILGWLGVAFKNTSDQWKEFNSNMSTEEVQAARAIKEKYLGMKEWTDKYAPKSSTGKNNKITAQLKVGNDFVKDIEDTLANKDNKLIDFAKAYGISTDKATEKLKEQMTTVKLATQYWQEQGAKGTAAQDKIAAEIKNVINQTTAAELKTKQYTAQLEELQLAMGGQELASALTKNNREYLSMIREIGNEENKRMKDWLALTPKQQAATKTNLDLIKQEADKQRDVAQAIKERKDQQDKLNEELNEYNRLIELANLTHDPKKALQYQIEAYRAILATTDDVAENATKRAILEEKIAQASAQVNLNYSQLLENGMKRLKGETWERLVKLFEESIPNAIGSVSDGVATLVSDVIMGAKSATEAWEDFGKSMKNMFASLLQEWLSVQMRIMMFGDGTSGTTGSTGIVGSVGSLISSIFGGGKNSDGTSATGISGFFGNLLKGDWSAAATSLTGAGSIGAVIKSLVDGESGTTTKALEQLWSNSFGSALENVIPDSIKNIGKDIVNGISEALGFDAVFGSGQYTAAQLATIQGNIGYSQAVEQLLANGATGAEATAIALEQTASELGIVAANNSALSAYIPYIGAVIAGIMASMDRIKKGDYVGGAIQGTAVAGGAAIGATVGTAIFPGIGTAIGSAVGAILGNTVGSAINMIKDGGNWEDHIGNIIYPAGGTVLGFMGASMTKEGTIAALATDLILPGLGEIVGALFSKIQINRQQDPAVRGWLNLNMADSGYYTGSTALKDSQGDKSNVMWTETGYAEVMTRANKGKSNLLEASDSLFGALQEVAVALVTTTNDMANLMPEAVANEWLDAISKMPIEVYGVFKSSKINSKKIGQWLESIQEEAQKVWVAAFQQLDFSDWEYAGMLDVNQGTAEVPRELIVARQFEQLTGLDALNALNDAEIYNALKSIGGMTDFINAVRKLAKTGGGMEFVLTTVESMTGEELGGMSAVDLMKAIQNSGIFGGDTEMGYETGPTFGWNRVEALQQEHNYDNYVSGWEGLQKFMAAMQGVALLETTIEMIKNPPKETTESKQAALDAIEQMRVFRETYLEGVGWTEKAMDDMMERYREAVAESFMKQIRDAINPLSELQQSVKDQMDQLEDWMDTMRTLSATQEQLAEIEAVRTNIQKELMDNAIKMVTPLTTLQSALNDINDYFDDLAGAMVLAGSSIDDLTKLELLRAQALKKTESAIKDSFYDSMKLTIMELLGQDTAREQLLQTQRADRISTAETFGMDSAEYNLLLLVQAAQLANLEVQEAATALDNWNTSVNNLTSRVDQAASNTMSAYEAMVSGVRDALATTKNNIKSTIDAWLSQVEADYQTAANAYLSALNADLNTYQRILDSMNSLQSSLWTDTTLNDNPTVYKSAKYELQDAYTRALAGDSDALDTFSSIAKTFLTASMNGTSDYGAYRDDFYMVQDMINKLRGDSEQQVTEIQNEIDLVQQQLDATNDTNKTLAELKQQMQTAYAEYQRVLEEQTAAYAQWGFDTVLSLEQQYRNAITEWTAVQDVANQLLLEGLITESQLSTLTLVAELQGLKTAYLTAAANEADLRKQLAAAEAEQAEALRKLVEASATQTIIADEAQKAVDEHKPKDASGIYGSKYANEAALLAAKAADLNKNPSQWNTSKEAMDFLKNSGAVSWNAGLVYQYMLDIAKFKSIEDWYLRHGIVEGFASGGLASGLVLVGERGPELMDLQTPGRVYSHEELSAALRTPAVASETDAGFLRQVIYLLQEQVTQTSEGKHFLQRIDRSTSEARDMQEQQIISQELENSGKANSGKMDWRNV